MIGFLAQVVAAGIALPNAKRLLDGAVNWLQAQAIDGGTFPAILVDDVPPTGTRLAWCYGDLGVASVLALAGQRCGESRWLTAAADLAARAAARPVEHSGVVDSGICHGAAGAAHLFNRLYQSSGDVMLRTAAREWIDRTLKFRRSGDGIGGFLTRWEDDNREVSWRRDPGLLTGAAGVGLVLLAAVSDVEPCWDSCLLLSPAESN